MVDGCWCCTFGQPRIFVFVNALGRDIGQPSSAELAFQLSDRRTISLASIRVCHFCDKLVGPFSKRRWSRFHEMETAFKYLRLPAREQLIGEALVRCMGTLTDLAAIDRDRHHPIATSLRTFV